jgi:hypothetical protein
MVMPDDIIVEFFNSLLSNKLEESIIAALINNSDDAVLLESLLAKNDRIEG